MLWVWIALLRNPTNSQRYWEEWLGWWQPTWTIFFNMILLWWSGQSWGGEFFSRAYTAWSLSGLASKTNSNLDWALKIALSLTLDNYLIYAITYFWRLYSQVSYLVLFFFEAAILSLGLHQLLGQDADLQQWEAGSLCLLAKVLFRPCLILVKNFQPFFFCRHFELGSSWLLVLTDISHPRILCLGSDSERPPSIWPDNTAVESN